VQTQMMSTQEQTEDRGPDEDEETVDEQSEDATAESESAPERQLEAPAEDARIEAVTERIDKARTQAEETGVLVDEDEETFVESGATEEADDQTIAPPG
jgi:hypothetical protein